jgi:hypothetical protein
MKLWAVGTLGLLAIIASATAEAREASPLKGGDKARAAGLIAQADLKNVLGKLQRRLSNGEQLKPGRAQATETTAGNRRRGLKSVESEDQVGGSADYQIPSSDLFLDRSAVGELAPSDDQVR